jgi:hypothetical protein
MGAIFATICCLILIAPRPASIRVRSGKAYGMKVMLTTNGAAKHALSTGTNLLHI